MKLFTSLSTAGFLSKHRQIREVEIPDQLRSSFKMVIKKPVKQRALLTSYKPSLKAQMIAQLHGIDVDGNHGGNNLKFHEIAALMRYSGSPEALNKVTKKREVGDPSSNSQLKVKPNPSIRVEDLDFIYEEMKRLLHLNRVLKQGSSRMIKIPGTFLLDDQGLMDPRPTDFKSLNVEKIIEMASATKESSMRLQSLISDGNFKDLAEFSEKIRPHLDSFITDKFACFVVQRLLVTYNPAIEMVEQLCIARFEELMKNEYSSRVIQLLIEKSPRFCEFSFGFIKTNFKVSISSSSACHLLVACLKNRTSKNEIDFIVDNLKKNSNLIGNRFFNRVLLTYCQVCSERQLDKLAVVMEIFGKVQKISNRKATNQIFVALLQRLHQPTIKALCDELIRNPERMFKTKYFTNSIHVATQDQPEQVMSPLFNVLSHPSLSTLDMLSRETEVLYPYVYLLLRTCRESQKPIVANLLANSSISSLISRLTANPTPMVQASLDPESEVEHYSI